MKEWENKSILSIKYWTGTTKSTQKMKSRRQKNEWTSLGEDEQ